MKHLLNLGSIPNPGQLNCEVQAGSVCTYYPFNHPFFPSPGWPKKTSSSAKKTAENLTKTTNKFAKNKAYGISPTTLALVSPGNVHNAPDERDHDINF